MSTRIIVSTLLLFCLNILHSSTAAADIVPERPQIACPAGTAAIYFQGAYSCTHAAPLCTTDSDCREGLQCLSVARCEETQASTRPGSEPSSLEIHFPDVRSRDCRVGTCTTTSRCTLASVAARDACGTGPLRPEGATVPAETETKSVALPGTQPQPPSRCAPVTAGLSATMAGMLGLTALGRRRL
jgi:hypothetical protein